jgi:hypothetical protein
VSAYVCACLRVHHTPWCASAYCPCGEGKVTHTHVPNKRSNLDLLLGLENRIMYTAIDVLEGECRLDQALLRDKRWKVCARMCVCTYVHVHVCVCVSMCVSVCV